MTNPYTTQTIANYNTAPPADDASAVASNQLFWSKHKDKLADPIKVLTEAINTENVAAHAKFLGYVTNVQSTTYSIVAGDEWKIIECTGTFTLTLLPSATAGNGFTLGISNVGTGVITVEGDTSELVGGATNQSLAKTGDSLILQCNGSSHTILADSRTSYEVAINEAKGTDIASATTTDIGAATGNYVDITGTTTITGLGTVQAGTRRIVQFDGALILTHNATSLILPTSANITTVAGDVAIFVSLGSGNWKCTSYLRQDGTPLSFDPPGQVLIETQSADNTGSSLDFVTGIDGTYDRYIFECTDIVPAADGRTLACRVSTDGGSTFKSGASDYNYAFEGRDSVPTDRNWASAGATTEIQLTNALALGSAAGEGSSYTVKLSKPANSSLRQMVMAEIAYTGQDGSITTANGAGTYLTAAAVDAIQFIILGGGNMESGTISLYGLSK